MIFLHNYLRWLIFIGIGYLIFFLFYSLYKWKEESAENLKQKIKKNFLYILILTDFQYLLGIFLLVFYFLDNSIKEFSSIFKVKELRFILIEHPFLMTIFIFWMHFLNYKIKKLKTIKEVKWMIFFLFISAVILSIGIPWFRPLLRY
ncbi:MAG: hypothetical protein ACK4UJ_05915 [Leptonema sp. (in: bacteria)]